MIRPIHAVFGAAALLLASSAYAADVKATGIHNCCPGCTKAITTALQGVATNVVTKPTEVSFSTDNPEKAIKALYDAGFAAKAEGVKLPPIEGAAGVKGKEIKVAKVHNCCGACTRAIATAVKPLGTSNAKPGEASFTITSDTEIDAEAVVKALRAAGYNAVVTR